MSIGVRPWQPREIRHFHRSDKVVAKGRPIWQLWTKSGVIGNLADLGAVLLRLDDGPLRKQAPYGHRQLPILPDIARMEPGTLPPNRRSFGGLATTRPSGFAGCF